MFQKLVARKLYKNIRQYIILLIMNHQPANFWGEEKLPEIFGKIQKQKVPLEFK